jgi:hypothetical protein
MADVSDSGLRAKHAVLNRYLNERQGRWIAQRRAASVARRRSRDIIADYWLEPHDIPPRRTQEDQGVRERKGNEVPSERVRREGAVESQRRPAVVQELERLVAPPTPGDRMSPLRWTSKEHREAGQGVALQRIRP